MCSDFHRETLSDWLAYLEQLHPQSIEMGLSRIELVRDKLELKPVFPVIIVGGTNGKGSVCAILESVLTAAGYRVGCYTSPHLIHYNERIRFRQKAVSDQQLIQAFGVVEKAREASCISLTYFEFGTLAAMYLCMVEQVDVAVLEVGLGGRLDAVNCFDADCAVLTSIDLDHQDYLGDSREAIGFEKAGIFRHDKPVVCAENNLPFSVSSYADKIGARLVLINRNFGFFQEKNQWHFWSQNNPRYTLPLPVLRGIKQLNNASASLMALEQLHDQLPVNMHAIRNGLLTIDLAGRFQVLSTLPITILDVAHNPAAASILAENLKMIQSSGRTYAVFAILQDKDIAGVIQELKYHIDVWLVAPIDAPRGAGIDKILEHMALEDINHENCTIVEFKNVISAYVFACEQANKNDRICVFGSFYTVGAVLRYHGEQVVMTEYPE